MEENIINDVNIVEEENTLTENIIVENDTSTNKTDEILYNTSVIANTGLFLVAFIVVIVVCYILYKAVDNFISF